MTPPHPPRPVRSHRALRALLPTGLGAAVLLVAMLAGAGCKSKQTAPSPGMGDPVPAPMNDPQITVIHEDLRKVLGFQPAIVVENEGPMSVQIPVRNLYSKRYDVDYRIIFFDTDDRQLEPLMGWRTITFRPKQSHRLKANALDDRARNYRVEVKWSR